MVRAMETIKAFLQGKQFIVLSSDYKTTPVSQRETIAVNDSDISSLSTYLRNTCELDEVLILSTCNRIEIYFIVTVQKDIANKVIQAFFTYKNLPLQNLFIVKQDEQALSHLLCVSAGLESMILGETQITGQLKNAFNLANKAKVVGFVLHKAFQLALVTAKKIRTNTNISRFAVSVSFAAVELAQKIFSDLAKQKVLLIGAGEVAELAALHLQKAGCQRLMVTNRTLASAVTLAEKFNGIVLPYATLEKNIEEADIIIASTGADKAIITADMLEPCMPRRKYRPLFLIDISVPRNIENACHHIEDVYLYDIDDLQTVVDGNLDLRRQAAQEADLFVQESVEAWKKWTRSLSALPVLKAFRTQVKDTANEELKHALKQLSHLSPEDKQVVTTMLTRSVNKILHSPSVKLKEYASNREALEEKWQAVDLLCDLFSLSLPEEKKEQAKNTREGEVSPPLRLLP